MEIVDAIEDQNLGGGERIQDASPEVVGQGQGGKAGQEEQDGPDGSNDDTQDAEKKTFR